MAARHRGVIRVLLRYAYASRRPAQGGSTPALGRTHEALLMLQQLIFPMLAHVLLTASLYSLLTIARAPAVWGIGRRSDGSNPFARFEPRISANLSNQFEWPLLFYAACILLHLLGATGRLSIYFAWLFVVGRVAHTCIQVFTANVRLRGAVFTVNFLAVIGMWAVILRLALSAA